MTRRPLLASALFLLATVTGCAALGLEHPPTAVPPAPTIAPSTTRPAAPTADPALTEAQAHAALITGTDLGAPWIPTRGAATWRDGMLKAAAPAGDCQRLLDALYADEVLGGPARAVVALDDPDTAAQLRYQLTGNRPADVDRRLAWLKTLPQKCARFTAKASGDAVLDVQVAELPLPEVGDVRQGLRVTLTNWATAEDDPDGDPTALTLDVAAVRAGEDAFALTNGGLGDVLNEATQAAVQLGVRRLADVRKQGRVQV
ncbi:hypothetical protein OG562_21830 [Streptomyces sp. NBC_01275]|uniref:hypothetical protein n=1 Tax=Streptomyces sp. NBC_01275 TaxID=2903807 RepID=UPI00225AE4E4|nr:hypothetical protein [Streptomyces sp. NBC_01275]MCX4763555.1 hypothetical protein [Streptomyces sp. NBC_01275]